MVTLQAVNTTAVRRPWAQALARETVPSGLLYSVPVCSGLYWSIPQRSLMFQLQQSLPLIPDWSALMQIRVPNPHSLIGQNEVHCGVLERKLMGTSLLISN